MDTFFIISSTFFLKLSFLNSLAYTSIKNDVKGLISNAIAFLPHLTASNAAIALPENGSKIISPDLL